MKESTSSRRAARASDREVRDRLLAGDEAAFVALVAQHDPALRRLAGCLLPSPDAVETVVADTWAAVLHGLRAFEARASLAAWIYGFLVTRALAAAAANDGDQPVIAPLDPTRFDAHGRWARPPAAATPKASVHDPLLRLPVRHRAVLLLRDAHGFSAGEVAELLGLSERDQHQYLHEARSDLLQRLMRSS